MPIDTDRGLQWAGHAFTAADQLTIQRLYDYMRGDQRLAFATEKFRSAFGRQFRSFAYNRMPMVVDAIADRMQITGFGSTPDDLATAWTAQWDANNMDVRAGQVEREQFIAGNAYVILELDPDSPTDVLIWPQTAQNVRVHYADDRPGHIDMAVKRWRDADHYDRLTIYYEDRIEKYRSRSPRALDPASAAAIDAATYPVTWERYAPDGEPWPLMLPVPDTVPVFHFANNAGADGRGVSELADVLTIQDALNKSVMDLLVAMEFAAFPQRYVVNLDMADDKTAESVDRVMAGIDRVLELYGESVSVGEFTAANIAQYTQVIELFDTMISRVSKVPVHYLQMTGDFGSGEARRLAEIPFVAKVDDRIRAATPVWADVARYGLRLLGRDVPPGAIKVNWAPTSALSEEEAVRLGEGKLRIGWSEKAVMREMGRDEEEIDKIQEELDEESERRIRRAGAGDIPSLFGGR